MKSFTSGEGVVRLMALLSAAYGDYKFIAGLQDVVYCPDVPVVDWLKATKIECPPIVRQAPSSVGGTVLTAILHLA